jgi:hypothetical protein
LFYHNTDDFIFLVLPRKDGDEFVKVQLWQPPLIARMRNIQGSFLLFRVIFRSFSASLSVFQAHTICPGLPAGHLVVLWFLLCLGHHSHLPWVPHKARLPRLPHSSHGRNASPLFHGPPHVSGLPIPVHLINHH